MSWRDIGQTVAKTAPALGAVMGGPLGGIVGAMIASVFGVESVPDQVAQAIAQDSEASFKLKQLENEKLSIFMEAQSQMLMQVNTTYRSEIASQDPYIARWRPTFGYAVAFTWSLQIIGIIIAVLYSVFSDQALAGKVIVAVGELSSALSMQWGVALAVLGVSVVKRSQDKKTAAQEEPNGFLTTFLSKLQS